MLNCCLFASHGNKYFSSVWLKPPLASASKSSWWCNRLRCAQTETHACTTLWSKKHLRVRVCSIHTHSMYVKHGRRQLSHSRARPRERSPGMEATEDILPVNVVLPRRSFSSPRYCDDISRAVWRRVIQLLLLFCSPHLRKSRTTRACIHKVVRSKWAKYQFWVNYPLRRSCCQKPPSPSMKGPFHCL